MDFEVWDFPHVDSLVVQHPTEDNAEPTIQEPELSPEEVQRQEEHQKLILCVTEHLQTISSISTTLSTQLQEINEQLLLNTTQLIKKITEKVIHKEMSIDNEQIATMITQALKEIHQDNEPCTIHIAPQHHEFLTTLASMPPDISFKQDATLKEGDFRIKTAYSELESILENRLNDIFGLASS